MISMLVVAPSPHGLPPQSFFIDGPNIWLVRVPRAHISDTRKVLLQFGMVDCNCTKVPMDPGSKLDVDKGGELVDATHYRKIIGCLRYLLHTRPDLSYSVGVASRFMEKPTVMRTKAVKQIMRYLHGTIDFGLVYVQGGCIVELVGYTDSDQVQVA
jgi:hypothetical protein